MSASYRMYWYWKYQLWATAALCALVAVLFTIIAVDSGFDSGFIGALAFLVVWLGIAVFTLHRVYWRIGSTLTLRDGVLIWRPPSGHAVTKELIQLRRVQPWRGGCVSVLIFTDGGELLVWVRKGFSDFVGLLQERQPWLDVRLSPWGDIVDSLWGPSGYERTR